MTWAPRPKSREQPADLFSVSQDRSALHLAARSCPSHNMHSHIYDGLMTSAADQGGLCLIEAGIQIHLELSRWQPRSLSRKAPKLFNTQTSYDASDESARIHQRQRASSEKSSLHLMRPSAFLASASLLACITSTAPGAADHSHN